jgi:hypothetical protein
MSGEMELRDVELVLDQSGRGLFKARIASLADYKALLARFQPETRIDEPGGAIRYIRLEGPAPAQPTSFPSNVSLSIAERPPRAGEATQRMLLNYLERLRYIDVISFSPPTTTGQAGILIVYCRTKVDYLEILRLVDEDHGACLRALSNGGLWYIHRLHDDAHLHRPFPQNVNLRVEQVHQG